MQLASLRRDFQCQRQVSHESPIRRHRLCDLDREVSLRSTQPTELAFEFIFGEYERCRSAVRAVVGIVDEVSLS